MTEEQANAIAQAALESVAATIKEATKQIFDARVFMDMSGAQGKLANLQMELIMLDPSLESIDMGDED